MARNTARPLSPHLTIWRWGPHMLVSILHRATGVALATAGATILTWWLTAAASGPRAYQGFQDWVIGGEGAVAAHPIANLLAKLVAIGLTLAFLQHLASGVRHLFMDMGANFELKRNKSSALTTMIFSAGATALLWIWILGGRG